jgi:hypothetical protein
MVEETRLNHYEGHQGYRKDILIGLGTPTGNLLVMYWRMFSYVPGWKTYESIRYLVQEG